MTVPSKPETHKQPVERSKPRETYCPLNSKLLTLHDIGKDAVDHSEPPAKPSDSINAMISQDKTPLPALQRAPEKALVKLRMTRAMAPTRSQTTNCDQQTDRERSSSNVPLASCSSYTIEQNVRACITPNINVDLSEKLAQQLRELGCGSTTPRQRWTGRKHVGVKEEPSTNIDYKEKAMLGTRRGAVLPSIDGNRSHILPRSAAKVETTQNSEISLPNIHSQSACEITKQKELAIKTPEPKIIPPKEQADNLPQIEVKAFTSYFSPPPNTPIPLTMTHLRQKHQEILQSKMLQQLTKQEFKKFDHEVLGKNCSELTKSEEENRSTIVSRLLRSPTSEKEKCEKMAARFLDESSKLKIKSEASLERCSRVKQIADQSRINSMSAPRLRDRFSCPIAKETGIYRQDFKKESKFGMLQDAANINHFSPYVEYCRSKGNVYVQENVRSGAASDTCIVNRVKRLVSKSRMATDTSEFKSHARSRTQTRQSDWGRGNNNLCLSYCISLNFHCTEITLGRHGQTTRSIISSPCLFLELIFT